MKKVLFIDDDKFYSDKHRFYESIEQNTQNYNSYIKYDFICVLTAD